MRPRRSLDLSRIIGAVTLAAAVGVVLLLCLNLLAIPSHYSSRLDDLNRRADNVEARLGSPGQPFAYPAHALCSDAPDAAALALKGRLSSAAGATSIVLSNVLASPGQADSSGTGLIPVNVTFDATGAYPAVLSFLSNLSSIEPEVFVSSAELKSQTTAVGFHFEGRIYCSASTRL